MKQLLCFLIASIFLMCLISGVTAEDALVAYYSFDGDAEDSSGNENHGVIKGNSNWDKGKFGDAIHLDVGTHVEMLVSESLHGDLFKTDPFTLSVWINPTFEGGEWQQIWRSLPGDAGHNTFFVNSVQGLLSWRGQVGGWTVLCQTDGGQIEKDEWSHAVVQSDGKTIGYMLMVSWFKRQTFKKPAGQILPTDLAVKVVKDMAARLMMPLSFHGI